MGNRNDMQLIMEDWRRFLNEDDAPAGGEVKVKDFLKLYATQKPSVLKKALGLTAKAVAGIGVGLLVGAAAGATTAGVGTGVGVVAGGIAAKTAEQAVGMIYDKIAERSGNLAKGLMAYLNTPDDSTDPLAKFFDIDDEFVALVQGLDSELGQKFQSQLFKYYQRVFETIDEEADGDRPLSEILQSTANEYFKHFLHKRRVSGVGVEVQAQP